MIDDPAVPNKFCLELRRRPGRVPQRLEIRHGTPLAAGTGLLLQKRRTHTLRHDEHVLLEAIVHPFRREAPKDVRLAVKDRQKALYNWRHRVRLTGKQLDK